MGGLCTVKADHEDTRPELSVNENCDVSLLDFVNSDGVDLYQSTSFQQRCLQPQEQQ
jgi:hypothetical protein